MQIDIGGVPTVTRSISTDFFSFYPVKTGFYGCILSMQWEIPTILLQRAEYYSRNLSKQLAMLVKKANANRILKLLPSARRHSSEKMKD